MKRLIATLLLCAMLFSIYVYNSKDKREAERIAELWGYSVPDEWEVEYVKSKTDFFYGNRDSYVVYKTEGDEMINREFSAIIEEEDKSVMDAVVDRLDIPEEHFIKEKSSLKYSCLTYINDSRMIIVLSPNEGKCYFIEGYYNRDMRWGH